MKKNMMVQNLFRSIVKSMGRYIAIVAIIALGAGLFVGLLVTKKDMIATGQTYLDEQNMFDLRLYNPYGWTDDDLAVIKQMEPVQEAEAVITIDVIGRMSTSDAEGVYQLYAIPETINKVSLRGGRMPAAPNECLADSLHASDDMLGKTFTVSDSNSEDALNTLTQKEFTIVGYVSSPLYMDMNRGSTSLGNGSVSAFVYVMPEVFQVESYTQIDITLYGSYDIYSDEYNAAMEKASAELKPMLEPLVQERYEEVYTQAQKAYAEGLDELKKGVSEYEKGRAEALRELRNGKAELETAELEIEENKKTIEDGEKQLDDARELIESSEVDLAEGKSLAYAQLADASTELLNSSKTVQENLNDVNSALIEVETGLTQINTGITQLEAGITQLDVSIQLIKTLVSTMDTALQTAQRTLEYAQGQGQVDAETIKTLEARIQELSDKKEEYSQQLQQLETDRTTYSNQLEELYTQKEELQKTQAELESAKTTLNDAMTKIQQGYQELENSKLQLEAEFAAAEASIKSAKTMLDAQQEELEKGKTALDDAQKQLADGWKQYWKGFDEANRKLSDAQMQIAHGRAELADAKKLIESMKSPDTYVLERNTNIGYVALENNSDIVAAVSKVFPAFFLLVAALVCITTMTRMVEDERTQIGTLKALGYSNGVIVGKYMAYAGSAAIVGCGLGVLVGSVVFPEILWVAYSLILNIKPDIEIHFDVPLCLGVVLAYTVVMLAVTWFCCRMVLRDVPAELIRPKAPASGKKILLEYLPFWDKLRFLNKVMFRNIFRYRQRLLMMLIGIGGCTALLVTGFGLGDSIMDIVAYQYEEVTVYDLQVQFADPQSDTSQDDFAQFLEGTAESVGFAHQSSVDIDFSDQTKSIYMIAADSTLKTFFDLHVGEKELDMPGENEVLLSKGTAEAMGIHVGEQVTIRNSDMEQMSLRVAGIFDNNVYNYAIVTPSTIEENWGEKPEVQMAYINLLDGQDAHQVAADISDNFTTMNILISQDLADQVGSMLEALDMVVITVVICASLLAVIVVYNLTNINISERIREIATIKVLGFNHIESAMYVFKENLLLSVFGAALGLVGGKFLLDFVMSQIKIDMVWMDARILPVSLLWSVIITLLSAILVDLLLYVKLEKINMAEALKSVE